MCINRLDAIMPTRATACFYTKFSGCQIQFIINDDKVSRAELVKAHRFSDRLTGKIHESLRFDQNNLLAVDGAVGNLSLKLFLPVGKTMTAEYFIRRHETDIMPVLRIFGARIAKSCNEQHGKEIPDLRKAIIRLPWLLLLLLRFLRCRPTSGQQAQQWSRW